MVRRGSGFRMETTMDGKADSADGHFRAGPIRWIGAETNFRPPVAELGSARLL